MWRQPTLMIVGNHGANGCNSLIAVLAGSGFFCISYQDRNVLDSRGKQSDQAHCIAGGVYFPPSICNFASRHLRLSSTKYN